MNKKLLMGIALTCVSVSVAAFAACGEHEHTYSADWANDATSHWHDCSGCDEKGSLENHTYGEWKVITAATEQKAGEEQRVCTVCDYTESRDIAKLTPAEPAKHEHDWSDWEVTDANKPTATEKGKATRTCANDDCDAEDSDKEYELPVLTSIDYRKTSDTATIDAEGTVTYTYNIDAENVSFTVTTPKIKSKIYTVTVTGEEGVTVKLGKYSGTTNSEGVATVKAEIDDYDVIVENSLYSYVAATITSENPAVTVDSLPEFKRGGATEFQALSISQSGVYYSTIHATQDTEIVGNYKLIDLYFKLRDTENAKKFTVKILSENTMVSPAEAGYELISGVNESYTIVLEAGQQSVFAIVSDDEDIDADYAFNVVYEVIVEDAPEEGDFLRPLHVQDNVESVTAVENAEQKVYYKLDYDVFGKYAEIYFGEGVTVYSLGFNKNNEGTPIESGDVVEVTSTGAYLYAVSTGENCSITVKTHYLDGMKQKPFTASFDGNNTPEFDVEEGILEQWYKLEATADGTYTVKPDNAQAILELYTDVEEEPVRVADSGASLVVALMADTPVYIRAASYMNKSYNFTVELFCDADIGSSTDAPIELTIAGEYNLYQKHYYTFTSEESVVLKFTAKGREDNVYFYATNIGFGSFATGYYQNEPGKKTLSFVAEANVKYYITTTNAREKDGGTFMFDILSVEHEVTFTVTDGTDTVDGVTVKVMDGETEVTSGVTVDGEVALTFVIGNYSLILDNLPAGYGLYPYSFKVDKDDNEQLQFNVTLTALEDYSLTVKLPDGSPAAGVIISFANGVTGAFSEVTNDEGVAKITQLPPVFYYKGVYEADSYTVTITLPDSMKDDYSFVEEISLTATEPAKQITLKEYIAPDGTQNNAFIVQGVLNSGTTTGNEFYSEDAESYLHFYKYEVKADGNLKISYAEGTNTVVGATTASYTETLYFTDGYYTFPGNDDTNFFELTVSAGDIVYIAAGCLGEAGEYGFNIELTAD